MMLKVTNIKTGLNKLIDSREYTNSEIDKIINFYLFGTIDYTIEWEI